MTTTATAKARATDLPARFGVLSLDQRIDEMRRMLATMKDVSASDTLRLLRERYPDVPLFERMQAISGLHS